jgi:hypothetical protein
MGVSEQSLEAQNTQGYQENTRGNVHAGREGAGTAQDWNRAAQLETAQDDRPEPEQRHDNTDNHRTLTSRFSQAR